ncbi:MAG: flagellar export protein FliJ [Microterricola sp.]
MTRNFALGGLLRLRRLEEDQAAGGLAAANAGTRESAAREAAARSVLSESTTTPGSLGALQGVAAARASSRSMVAELSAVTAERRRRAEEAQQEYSAARKNTLSLEKLAVRHAESEAQLELQAEQIVLDELAGTAWQRGAKQYGSEERGR